MKVLSISVLFIWAAVNARPDNVYFLAPPYDQDFATDTWSPDVLENEIGQFSTIYKVNEEPASPSSDAEHQTSQNHEEFIIDDCDQLAMKKNHSAKTIITTDDKITKCITDLSRVIDPNEGVVIILGVNPLNVMHLHEHSKLFFNKYYLIPKHIEDIQSYIYNQGLNLKVFVTRKVITIQLYELIRQTKYEDAVDLGKYLFKQFIHTSIGKEIIADVVNTFLKDEDYVIMNYAYKLMTDNASDIIKSCFPSEFYEIFSGNAIKIRNKDQTAELKLSKDIDYYDDRWLYSDCHEDKFAMDPVTWRFNPVWNATIDSVVFEIYNIEYNMRLKLNWQTTGHFNEEREAFGDHRPVDDRGRYQWRLMPTGVKQDSQLLFCIVEEVYESYLVPNHCEFENKDVRGIKTHCSPQVGWFIESSKI